MVEIDPEVASRMLDHIRADLDELLIPKCSGTNPGVAQYDLIGRFGFLSANEIRAYLIDLERRGELRLVEERGPKLNFYLPVNK